MDVETKVEVVASKLEALGHLFTDHSEFSGVCFILEDFAKELHEIAGEVRGKV